MRLLTGGLGQVEGLLWGPEKLGWVVVQVSEVFHRLAECPVESARFVRVQESWGGEYCEMITFTTSLGMKHNALEMYVPH